MNEVKFWQLDAFTQVPFKGNPAAVFLLEHPLDDALMQNIAIEMNLSESAFILLRKGQNPLLRWFTPMYEIDLCGHATLASAQVYFAAIEPKATEVIFDTKFAGPLKVKKNSDKLIMNLPARPGKELNLSSIPNFVLDSLSKVKPIYARKARDLMLVYPNDQVIFEMKPNFDALYNYEDFIAVTAKSSDEKYDFVSRFFCAKDGILEDPVTGSAHCTLAPYWAEKLNKSEMCAYQASKRGGILYLKQEGDRLIISGEVVNILKGTLALS